jgi:hypothetical protein
MKIDQLEDRRWCVFTKEGLILAGPFDRQAEAVLAELEISQKVAAMLAAQEA